MTTIELKLVHDVESTYHAPYRGAVIGEPISHLLVEAVEAARNKDIYRAKADFKATFKLVKDARDTEWVVNRIFNSAKLFILDGNHLAALDMFELAQKALRRMAVGLGDERARMVMGIRCCCAITRGIHQWVIGDYKSAEKAFSSARELVGVKRENLEDLAFFFNKQFTLFWVDREIARLPTLSGLARATRLLWEVSSPIEREAATELKANRLTHKDWIIDLANLRNGLTALRSLVEGYPFEKDCLAGIEPIFARNGIRRRISIFTCIAEKLCVLRALRRICKSPEGIPIERQRAWLRSLGMPRKRNTAPQGGHDEDVTFAGMLTSKQKASAAGPDPVAILRGRGLGLKSIDVARELLRHVEQKAIPGRIEISWDNFKYHRQRLYGHFGVHSRDALRRILSGLPNMSVDTFLRQGPRAFAKKSAGS